MTKGIHDMHKDVDEKMKHCQQIHRWALAQACDKLEMNLAEYGRRIGIESRQVIWDWQKRGRIPAHKIIEVAKDAGIDPVVLIDCPRKPYGKD